MSFTDFSCLRFLALLFCFASLASAEEKTSGDWKYSVDAGGTGTIVQYTGSESDVSVPAALERVKITHIGDNAFALTANYEGTDSLTRVVLPEGVSEIGTAAFEYRKKLKNVVISGSVERIGFWPFSNCDALANIEVKPENNAYSSSDGVLFNKEDKTLFHYPVGKPDKIYTIPSWVEVIGDCAFVKAKNLNEVIIPEGVKVIGLRAFDEASNLQKVVIPSTVETIRDNAFWGCTSLTNIVVPNSVTAVGKRAFERSGLTSATLPEALLSEADTFGFSQELAAKLKAQVPPMGANADPDAPTTSNKAPEPSRLPTLTVGGVTYKNAILHKEYPLSLFIRHDGGSAFLKRSELTKSQLEDLAGTSGN